MSFNGHCERKLKHNNEACRKSIKTLNTLSPAYNNQIAYIRSEHSTLDLAEYFFRRGVEVSQQIGNDQYFNILNRLFLALTSARKGQWSEALAIGAEAFDDALAQGGMIAPIAEMALSVIFIESGQLREARERLDNTAALLRKMANRQGPSLRNDGQPKLGVSKPKQTEITEIEKEMVSPVGTAPYLFRIQMFGPFRLFYHDQELEATSWRTVKCRDLLAYLAHHDKPVSTDQILEDLWPNLNLDKASAVFHTTLYYLRRLLQRFTDKEIIIRGAKRYQLLPGSILIDRRQFEEVAQSALKKTMTDALANELETAAALYRGDYLEDLDYHWLMPVREELRSINTGLKQELAAYYLQNRMYSRAVVHLRQLMALKPYSEEVLLLLLKTLASMGDLAAVKEQFEAFAQTVLGELGLQPSAEITAFYQELCGINYRPATVIELNSASSNMYNSPLS